MREVENGHLRQLERRLSQFVLRKRVPGLQYVAVDAKNVLIDFCGGWAQMRTRPMSSDSTLMAYSMSKTITAATVLQLIDRKRLGLDDAIAEHLPWQPYGPNVTVRQLLAHTAGLPNPIPLSWVHALDAHGTFDEQSALRNVVLRYPTRSRESGARFAYSNIGYWLLGSLIEQVSGECFASYVQSHVFAPLGLTARDMDYVISDPAQHASGYLERCSLLNLIRPFFVDASLIGSADGRWLEIRPHYVNGAAFGGILARATAFGRFLQDQLGEQSCLFGEHASSLMLEQQRTRHGFIPMTLAWHLGSRAVQRYYFKEGGGAGFHCMMRLYKDKGLGTVLMTNATTFNVSKALNIVDTLLMAK